MEVALDRGYLDGMGSVCGIVFECMHISDSVGAIFDQSKIKLYGLR
jgi:hypothetical protein